MYFQVLSIAMATQAGEEWWRDEDNVLAIQHYAHLAGLLYHLPGRPGVLGNIPLTLQPANFPKELFQLVWELQPQLNSLVDAVSRDTQFLSDSLSRSVAVQAS